ncbi:MAG: acyl carrier protein [Campylobacterota bacterium]|nr:acyl carrier protein [Campylobacterota bacterium]
MTKEEIKKRVIEQILEVAPDVQESEISDNENIQRSLEIDSFDFLKILVALSEKVGVEVPESDYSKVSTVEKMVEYLANRQK